MDPSILSRVHTRSVFTNIRIAILREINFLDFTLPGFPVCSAVQLSAEMTAMVDNEGEMQSKLGLMTARCRPSLAASVVEWRISDLRTREHWLLLTLQ